MYSDVIKKTKLARPLDVDVCAECNDANRLFNMVTRCRRRRNLPNEWSSNNCVVNKLDILTHKYHYDSIKTIE